MNKAYYAVSSPYGVRTVYDMENPPTVYRFESEKVRDRFIEDRNDMWGEVDPRYEAITEAEAMRYRRPADQITIRGRTKYGEWYGKLDGQTIYV